MPETGIRGDKESEGTDPSRMLKAAIALTLATIGGAAPCAASERAMPFLASRGVAQTPPDAAPDAIFAEVRGRVVKVADGDTLTVLDAANNQHKIRLNAIDAPEYRTKWKSNRECLW